MGQVIFFARFLLNLFNETGSPVVVMSCSDVEILDDEGQTAADLVRIK